MTFGQSVPFEIPDINHGLKKAEGLIKLWENGIELEFEVEDAFLGVSKSEVQTVRISYGDLEAIQFEKGWFKASIVLKGTSMKVFDDVPATEAGTCTLKIERKNREEAQALITKARMRHSQYRLDQMDDE
jgi:hypothetical protein